MERKRAFVRFGDFLFKWRNQLFPVVVLALFLGFRPAITLLGSALLDAIRDGLGLGLVIAGLALRFATIGWAYIKRGGHQKRVHADTLVGEGYFALSRNPLYVGNMAVYAGLFVMHGNPWAMVLGIGGFYLFYRAIIAAEEHFLSGKFGADYAAYCRDVPRWWPDFPRHAEAVQGMRFSLDRSLTKDYTTIANALIALIILRLLEAHAAGGGAAVMDLLPLAGAGVAAVALIALVIRRHKKRMMGAPPA